jgi:hypothetical protein
VGATDFHPVAFQALYRMEVSKSIEIPFLFEANIQEGSIVMNHFDYSLGNEVKTSKAYEETTITIISKLIN